MCPPGERQPDEGVGFTVGRHDYSLSVGVHDIDALNNGVRETIGLEDFDHLSPMYRVKGFCEVNEGDDALEVLVFDSLELVAWNLATVKFLKHLNKALWKTR